MAVGARPAEFDGRIGVGGTRLAYRYLHADRRGPLLLFLHEGLGSTSLWRDVPGEIGERSGLPVLIYDREGYGRSDPLRTGRTRAYLHDYAWRELPALLAALDEHRPLVLIGHSDGGTIALLFAARFPDRVVGIVTEAAHVFVEPEALAGIRRAVIEFEQGDLRDRLRRYHGEKTDATFRAWSDTWTSGGFRGWNIEAEIGTVVCPILALQGADDEYGTPAQLDSIRNHVSGPCRTILLPDCGHVPHFQSRQLATAAIVEFVKSVTAN
jgi:pimeloyl-ACP methyl ester carboxylesterase